MGEIGLDRKEYLYVLTFCDLLCIERGYYRRQRASWEQARLVAYHVRYCMGLAKNETAKTLTEWLPFSWEKEPADPTSIPTEEEIAEMMDMMREMNAQNEKSDT